MTKVHCPFYYRWRAMIRSVRDKSHPSYQLYGARGFSVCREWLDFETFKAWCERTHWGGLVLNIKAGETVYSPENCEWITVGERRKRVKKCQ